MYVATDPAGYNGDTSRHVVRDTRDQSEKATHSGTVLSCDELIEIWITWTNMTILVGTGGKPHALLIM